MSLRLARVAALRRAGRDMPHLPGGAAFMRPQVRKKRGWRLSVG